MPKRTKLPKAVLNRASRSELQLSLEKYLQTSSQLEGALDPLVEESRDESRRRRRLRNEAGLSSEEFVPVSNTTPRNYRVIGEENLTRGILTYTPSWQNQLKFKANQKRPKIVDIGADRTEDRASVHIFSPMSLMPEVLTENRRLNIPATLRSLAAIRKEFPNLKELKVNVEHPQESPAYLKQKSATGDGIYTPPDYKYFTRTIKLRRK